MRVRTARPPERGARVPFAMVCCALIAATMVALLGLNIAAAQDSYAQDELDDRLELLLEQQEALRERLEGAQAPGSLERRATEEGMVRMPSVPALVSLRDDAVLGRSRPAPDPGLEEDADPVPTSGAGTRADDGSAGDDVPGADAETDPDGGTDPDAGTAPDDSDTGDDSDATDPPAASGGSE